MEGFAAFERFASHCYRVGHRYVAVHDADATGGIGDDHILLGFGRGAFQHGIEDFHGIFGSFATIDVALFDVLQTQIDGREHLLEVVGANLEATGQRDFVVAVVGGDDTEVVADALVQIGVEAQLRLVGGTVQRVLGVARIDERTE